VVNKKIMSPEKFQIKDREIGSGQPCFIIAEMSGNHKHDINRAKAIIDAAAEAQVDAVKMQTYTPDTMTIDCREPDFIVGKANTWAGQSLYELYQSAYTPWEWQAELKVYGEKQGVLVFSTPFDPTAVDFLEKLDVAVYKVASFEAVDTELLAKIGHTKKPVILSRGLTSAADLKIAVDTLKENGAPAVAVLHCVSSYPALLSQMNLAHIKDIRERFGVVAGLSDHSLGLEASCAAVGLLQAAIIEKHFTLKRADGGPDAGFSLEPAEMKQLVRTIRDIEKNGYHPTADEEALTKTMLGTATYEPDAKEKENLVFVRSLYIVADMQPGEILTKKNLGIIRPGYGLQPKHYRDLLGKPVKTTVKRGTRTTWDLIK
jgi:pseudaminic acid synthase